MVRRSNYKIVETVISALNSDFTGISFEKLSDLTQIKIKNLKNWVNIINLIQKLSPTIEIKGDQITVVKSKSKKQSDYENSIKLKLKQRKENANIQDFLSEFNTVLTKTKLSLEDDKIKNYPQLRQTHQKNKNPDKYTDLHSELAQALQHGLSFLKPPEIIDTKAEKINEINFLDELKQAVNLGIENLEHVVITEYKEKKGRVNAMKSELEMVFKEREERSK